MLKIQQIHYINYIYKELYQFYLIIYYVYLIVKMK